MKRLWWFGGVVVCLSSLGLSCAQPRPKAKPFPRPSAAPVARPVAEIRAVWVSNTDKLDWDKATRDLQRAGFNTMYINLVSAGATFYPRSLALPSAVEAGKDPVARGIGLAHRRGLAVHAKFIVLFAFKSPTDFQRRMLRTDRVMRGANGQPIVQSRCYWLCPSQPANRNQMKAAIRETLIRYPVDGVQFDYIRFNEEPSCFCQHCREAFEKYAGQPLHRWPADVLSGAAAGTFNEWRQQLITDWARELSATARQVRPGIKVSAAVFPILPRAREEKGQDWKLWVDRGYLDHICTMNYTTDTREFEQRHRATLAVVPRERVVAGLGSWKFTNMAALRNQIEVVRRTDSAGIALFSYDDCEARDFLPDLNRR